MGHTWAVEDRQLKGVDEQRRELAVERIRSERHTSGQTRNERGTFGV